MDFTNLSPYELNSNEKETFLSETLGELTRRHYENCLEYHRMLDAIEFNPYLTHKYDELPFLPVSLFKTIDLKSVPKENIFKTMTSSGTTGQAVSKIYLDRETSVLQQKVLVKIVESFMGASRCPMLIIDCPSVVKDRKMFSARGAGILGFSMFGVDKTYALNDDMELDVDVVRSFLKKHEGEKILLFGFTFMIWRHFLRVLESSDFDKAKN